MPARTDGRGRGAASWLAATLIALVLSTGMAAAQGDPAKRWNDLAETAEKTLGAEETSTEELENLRVRLVAQRSEALAAEQAGEPAVAELSKRLEALGPAPAEGVSEAPEIAQLRRQLQGEIAEAQAPVLAAQEIYRRTDTLVKGIDHLVRSRFSAELAMRGPSPLQPTIWLSVTGEIAAKVRDHHAAISKDLVDPAESQRPWVSSNLLLMLGGLTLAIIVRRWLVDWVESRLGKNPHSRWSVWLVALRNLTRIVVPLVGAGLFFAAFDPQGLLERTDEGQFFKLPSFVVIFIASGWLAGSLLAPKHRMARLVPLADDEARRAHALVLGLGAIASLYSFATEFAVRWDLSTEAQTVILFPLVLLGAIGLWRIAKVMEAARRRIAAGVPAASRNDPATLMIGRRFIIALIRFLLLVAVIGPLLAAAGYLPAASFLVFRTAMTLGLIGGAYVIFDLLNRTAQVFLANPTAPRSSDDGLMPVVVGTLVALGALPLLAMTWGARWSDVADFWTMLREGVTFGGIRLSATAVVMLILVFLFGIGLTRLLQTVLRGTVLPRTRLDAGGRNAVLAGVGYVGFAISGLAAVAAAGLNLSSLAIVAGALSVGIGFGMQNIVSNFVSGIILLVERPVKEGDWIEVGGFSGHVRGINVRSTEIETFDRASVILPNSDLIAGTVLNRTHSGMSGRLQIPVSVTYDCDPKQVESILVEIAEAHPLVLLEPSPRVLFLDLGTDTMNFELRCWLRDVNFLLSAKSDMNYEIIARFREAGIRTQYYGRDLPTVPAAVVEPDGPPETPGPPVD